MFITIFQLSYTNILSLNSQNIISKVKDEYVPLHIKNNWKKQVEEIIVSELMSMQPDDIKR